MALIQGGQLDFVFNSSTPYIEDYNQNQQIYFDQQDLSDDLKKPIFKKKELQVENNIENFYDGRGSGGIGPGGMGAGGMGAGGMGAGGMGAGGMGAGGMGAGGMGAGGMGAGGMGYGGMGAGGMGGRGMGYGGMGGRGMGAGGMGGRGMGGRGMTGGWTPYYINTIPNVNLNYWDNESPYYYGNEPREIIIEKPIYITEKKTDEESVKIETMSEEKKSKKTKKTKKTEKNENKKNVSNKTLWNIIIILIIIIIAMGIKICYDNKLIKF
jgi:hypothetical protein